MGVDTDGISMENMSRRAKWNTLKVDMHDDRDGLFEELKLAISIQLSLIIGGTL